MRPLVYRLATAVIALHKVYHNVEKLGTTGALPYNKAVVRPIALN